MLSHSVQDWIVLIDWIDFKFEKISAMSSYACQVLKADFQGLIGYSCLLIIRSNTSWFRSEFGDFYLGKVILYASI